MAEERVDYGIEGARYVTTYEYRTLGVRALPIPGGKFRLVWVSGTQADVVRQIAEAGAKIAVEFDPLAWLLCEPTD